MCFHHALSSDQWGTPVLPVSGAYTFRCMCVCGAKLTTHLVPPTYCTGRKTGWRGNCSTCVIVFCQTTVGAGSPEIGTSRRNLFPATTTMVSGVLPGQSKWILGGSVWRSTVQRKGRCLDPQVWQRKSRGCLVGTRSSHPWLLVFINFI